MLRGGRALLARRGSGQSTDRCPGLPQFQQLPLKAPSAGLPHAESTLGPLPLPRPARRPRPRPCVPRPQLDWDGNTAEAFDDTAYARRLMSRSFRLFRILSRFWCPIDRSAVLESSEFPGKRRLPPLSFASSNLRRVSRRSYAEMYAFSSGIVRSGRPSS